MWDSSQTIEDAITRVDEACIPGGLDEMNVDVNDCKKFVRVCAKVPEPFGGPLSYLRTGQRFVGGQYVSMTPSSTAAQADAVGSLVNTQGPTRLYPNERQEFVLLQPRVTSSVRRNANRDNVQRRLLGADQGVSDVRGAVRVAAGAPDAGSGGDCGDSEALRVSVRIDWVDLTSGQLSGSMEARNVPNSTGPSDSVQTYWDGQIVDNHNFSFSTLLWDASPASDERHWSRFRAFQPLHDAYKADGCAKVDLAAYPYIFMRWKERCFVNAGNECGLTIAGFYYVCLSRKSGKIVGFYFDPSSSPFQRLVLDVTDESLGHAFSEYTFC